MALDITLGSGCLTTLNELPPLNYYSKKQTRIVIFNMYKYISLIVICIFTMYCLYDNKRVIGYS